MIGGGLDENANANENKSNKRSISNLFPPHHPV